MSDRGKEVNNADGEQRGNIHSRSIGGCGLLFIYGEYDLLTHVFCEGTCVNQSYSLYINRANQIRLASDCEYCFLVFHTSTSYAMASKPLHLLRSIPGELVQYILATCRYFQAR